MQAEDRTRLIEATECAYRWHEGQFRNEHEIPYVSHLLQVNGLVLEHGGDTDQAIAALLHDSLEDVRDPAERVRREKLIRERFGEGVLEIVLHCTDTRADESLEAKRDWQERKADYVAHLAETPERSRLVVACDKRHNLHAIVWDVKTHGPGVFRRFKSSPEQQIWYFESVVGVLRDSIPARLRAELEDLLEDLRQLVAPERGG